MTHVTWLRSDDPIPAGRSLRIPYPTYLAEPEHREWLTEQLAAKLEYAHDTTVTAMAIHIGPHPDANLHKPPGKYCMITAVNTAEKP